jgi:hypothetical protein
MLNRTAFSEESNAAAITTPRMEFHPGQYPSDSASKQPFDANQSTPNESGCRTRWGAFSLRSKKLTLFVHALFGRTRLNRSGTETLASQPPGTTTTSNFSASTMLCLRGWRRCGLQVLRQVRLAHTGGLSGNRNADPNAE